MLTARQESDTGYCGASGDRICQHEDLIYFESRKENGGAEYTDIGQARLHCMLTELDPDCVSGEANAR